MGVNNKQNMDKQELSGVMVIIIIGGGVLMSIILFIFAKRQIMRFTIRSRGNGPHLPVGYDSKKSIKKEIERRLDSIQSIAYEPQLIFNDSKYILRRNTELPPYYYRLKAVDDVKILEKEIARYDGRTRAPRDSLRAFLVSTLATTLNGCGQRLIHQFCDMYEHARHDPNEFGSDEYEGYYRLFMKLLDATKLLKSLSSSRRSSPSRTPVKKQTSKMHSLLDPSRLRPPPAGNSSNARMNLSLGVQQPDHDENDILSISQDGEPSNEDYVIKI